MPIPKVASKKVAKVKGVTSQKTSIAFDIDPKKGKHLVIVESPAKCKTIGKYL